MHFADNYNFKDLLFVLLVATESFNFCYTKYVPIKVLYPLHIFAFKHG